ncbi:MAG: glycosyltransferase [Proteobacteria bacterium]|nr:glycosyltransferase [Pseudomonadota bacterium]MCH9749777.1 glycosyltransferase [Pseudomonadota bacterium]
MDGTPLVSIIMNCYNGEKYLSEAINSVYAQTFDNWEIIFWDNASTDSSAAIAHSYNSKLKYFRSKNTSTLGEARSLAVDKAKGQYLAFLDCDDVWLSDKLEMQVDLFLKDSSLAIVYGYAEIFYSDQAKKSKPGSINIIPNTDNLFEGMIFDKLIREDFIPFPSTVIDKDKFIECGGFPKDYNHSTDYWVFLHMSFKYKVGAIKKVCCRYRIHLGNLSHSQAVLCALENIRLVKTFLPNSMAAENLIFHYVNLSIAYLKERRIIDAFLTLYKYGGWGILAKRVSSKLAKINYCRLNLL